MMAPMAVLLIASMTSSLIQPGYSLLINANLEKELCEQKSDKNVDFFHN